MNIFLLKLLIILFLLSCKLSAQQFVYVPLNPSFGGNYFNGSYFLSLAQAQNDFTEKISSYDSYKTDPLADFKESLNRQILNTLSRELIVKVFGEEAFNTAGKYEIGDYIIDVTPGASAIHIEIQDINTGNTTTIEVPYY